MAVTSESATQKKRAPRKAAVPNPPEKTVKEDVKDTSEEKVLVRMERGSASWTTHDGVKFTKQHPYQLVTEGEADLLMMEGGFRKAHPDELKQWYGDE